LRGWNDSIYRNPRVANYGEKLRLPSPYTAPWGGGKGRLRKRLKRLRYALEFIESELPSKGYKRCSKALTNVLNDLDEYNDLIVAIEGYRGISEVEPRAWFAIGWLMAQLSKAERRCIKALAVFNAAKDPCNPYR